MHKHLFFLTCLHLFGCSANDDAKSDTGAVTAITDADADADADTDADADADSDPDNWGPLPDDRSSFIDDYEPADLTPRACSSAPNTTHWTWAIIALVMGIRGRRS